MPRDEAFDCPVFFEHIHLPGRREITFPPLRRLTFFQSKKVSKKFLPHQGRVDQGHKQIKNKIYSRSTAQFAALLFCVVMLKRWLSAG